jgi:hypothetical protein
MQQQSNRPRYVVGRNGGVLSGRDQDAEKETDLDAAILRAPEAVLRIVAVDHGDHCLNGSEVVLNTTRYVPKRNRPGVGCRSRPQRISDAIH